MLGKKFISACLATGSVAEFLNFGSISHLFKASEVEVYDFVRDFVKEYAKLPEPETIEAHTGESLPSAEEPAEYYFDLMKLRHTELELKKAMKKASDFLLPENKDPDKARDVLVESIMGLVAQKYGRSMVDFQEAYDLLIPDYVSKYNSADDNRLYLGWPTLDEMTGGVQRGDMISYVGKTGTGKTWQMLYGAFNGWNDSKQKQSRLFVSMEMDPVVVSQRLAALRAQVSPTHIKHATLTTDKWKKFKKNLIELKSHGAPFWIVDGNLAATVEDIWMLARQLKPDAIFIDGAYLVKHPTEKDRYRRVAENADLIKKELSSIAPTVCSWQFARTKDKKKGKGEKPGLEDIGYSNAIAEVSSLVLGLFDGDDIESLKTKTVEVLKGRNGETGSFKINWIFEPYPDFSEYVEESPEDLQIT